MGTKTILIISVAIILLSILLFAEIKRRNKKELILRIIFSALAFISMACIGIDIKTTSKSAATFNEAILITKGYNNDSLQQFLSYKNIPVYNVANIDSLLAKNFSRIHVFGYGLNDNQLSQLHNLSMLFHPSVANNITTANWQQHIKSGEQLQLQGTYNNNLNKPVKLILNGLGTNLDSAIIPANKILQFSLSCLPKHTGEAVYHLFALDKIDTIENNSVPVEVTSISPIKVLLLSSSPNFENKFLKNWLSANGCAVAEYVATSKNKSTESFINTKAASLNNITSSSLDSFDVVITNSSFLFSVGRQQQAALQTQIQKKGLGLITIADSVAGSAWFMNNIKISATQRLQQPLLLQLNNNAKDSFHLPVEQISYLQNIYNTRSLLFDAQKNTVGVILISGIGKKIVTTLNSTYQLALSGDTIAYSKLWSYLMQKVAREKQYSENITTAPFITHINQPSVITVQSALNNFSLKIDGSEVYLKQDALLPFIKTGSFWPTHTGWHMIKSEQQFNWYVFDSTDYKNVAAAKKLEATKHFIKQQQSQPITPTNAATTEKSLSKIWFVILFIISCTYLWIERKLVV